MNTQGEFRFEAAGNESGYVQWLAARQVAAGELARRMHLPIGHAVEVWLTGGVRLQGKLRLAEEFLIIEEDRARHLPLKIDNVSFTYREIESCVRLD